MSKEAEKLADAVFKAAINCGHEIEEAQIVLHFNPSKPGHNALNQLHLRIEEACRRQAEQIRELREALTAAASSLTYIANTACKRDEELMADAINVRGYARSRASVAEAALSNTKG